jgi:hypothetical protein
MGERSRTGLSHSDEVADGVGQDGTVGEAVGSGDGDPDPAEQSSGAVGEGLGPVGSGDGDGDGLCVGDPPGDSEGSWLVGGVVGEVLGPGDGEEEGSGAGEEGPWDGSGLPGVLGSGPMTTPPSSFLSPPLPLSTGSVAGVSPPAPGLLGMTPSPSGTVWTPRP